MYEPKSNLIRETVIAGVTNKYGKNKTEFLGEWESVRDFTLYCWQDLGNSLDCADYLDWKKIYQNLESFGYVGLLIEGTIKATGGVEYRAVYGFKIK